MSRFHDERRSEKIQSIMLRAGDAQRRGKISWTARQIAVQERGRIGSRWTFAQPAFPGELASVDDLPGADQHPGGDAGGRTHQIQREVHSVTEIDVGMPRTQEHRGVALRLAVLGMASWVIAPAASHSHVGFDFGDAQAYGAFRAA